MSKRRYVYQQGVWHVKQGCGLYESESYFGSFFFYDSAVGKRESCEVALGDRPVLRCLPLRLP